MTAQTTAIETVKVQNSLSRWHKVADRVRVASKALETEILETLNKGLGLNSDTFSVRKGVLKTETAVAISTKKALRAAMQKTLFQIRRELARANVNHGISDILNAQEEVKQDLAFHEQLIGATDDRLSVGELESLVTRRAGQDTRYQSDSVTFVTDEAKAALIAERDALKIKRDQLSDRLADANAERLALDIDKVVAQAIGI